MPYWKAEEIKIDCDGNEIKPGDILEQKELNAGNASWRYFVCYTSEPVMLHFMFQSVHLRMRGLYWRQKND